MDIYVIYGRTRTAVSRRYSANRLMKKVIYGEKGHLWENGRIDCKIVRGPALRGDVIYGEKVIYESACVRAPQPCPTRPVRSVPVAPSFGEIHRCQKGHLWGERSSMGAGCKSGPRHAG
jgi:hypothetical protein